MVDSKRLIITIAKYRCIWNTQLTVYKNTKFRERAWICVCKDIIEEWNEFSVEEKKHRLNDVQKRWSSIRARFRRELNSQKNIGTGRAAKKHKPYVFAEVLSFMIPVLEEEILKRTSGNYISDRDDDESEPGPKTTVSPARTASPGTFRAATATPTTARTKSSKSSKKTQLDPLGMNIIRAVENKSTAADNEEDPDLMFLKSLLPDVKLLNQNKKFAFKLGIMQLYKSIVNQ